MLNQIFLPPQEKRRVIISYKHDVYELSHELPNELALTILVNLKISRKSQNFLELYGNAQSSF